MQGGNLFRPVIMLKGIYLILFVAVQSNLVAVLYLASSSGCSNISLIVRIRSKKSDEDCHQETIPVNIYHRHLAVS